MQKINTILFDLDGTLVDSNELILDTFDKTIHFFFPDISLTKSQLLEMMGPPLHDTFSHFTKEESTLQEMIKKYREIYVNNEFELLRSYPKVSTVLASLKKQGYHLGIVTTKYQVSAMPSIKRYNIDKYIPIMISLDDVTSPKPSPEPVNVAISKFSNVTGVLMVGDNASDIYSGKNASVYTCGVKWSYKLSELELSKPDYWINDFEDLYSILDFHNKEN